LYPKWPPRDLLSRPLGIVIALSVAVVLLTTGRVLAAPNGPCVRILSEDDQAYRVTLGPGCDLREVARTLPQRDGDSGDVLPMQEQLRSIYAYNEKVRGSSPDASGPPTVRRGCVPGAVPEGATPEERELCPKGLVNYYGIASSGNQAVIHVPRTRIATLAERLESLGRAACGTLAGVKSAYPEGASIPKPLAESLSACESQLAGGVDPVDLGSAPPAPVTSGKDAPPVTAANMALERRVKELEQRSQALVAAAQSQQLHANLWIGILGAAAILLLGYNVLLWTRLRRARSGSSARAADASPDREQLAQALAQVKKELKAKLAQASESHGTQLREQIAAMQTVEQEYEEAIEHIRHTLGQRVSERDEAIAKLENKLAALSHELEQAGSRERKAEKQVAKLRTRLQQAKGRDSERPEGDVGLIPAT